MTITLDLPKSLEHQLREEAAQRGMTLDRHIFQRLAEPSNPIPDEADLLLKIRQDLGLTPETWSRYERLIRQRRAEELTDYEYEELMALTDIIEHANVERLKLLVQLAKLRETSLEQVMSDLEIGPRSMFPTLLSPARAATT
jgi:hypothetical protein